MSRVPWLFITVAGALVTVLLEAMVLQRKYLIFTGGYLQPSFLSGVDVPIFLIICVILDVAAVALFAPMAHRVMRGLRSRPRRFVAATLLATAPLLGCMIARMGITQFAIDTISFQTGWPGSAARSVVTLLLIAGPAGATWFAAYLPWPGAIAPAAGSARSTVLACTVLVIASFATFVGTGLASQDLQDQVARTTAGVWLVAAGQWLTDFDRDGSDWTRAPFDRAPFDPRIHPFAVDLPGNGLDENGLNGDLAQAGGFAAERFEPVRFARRPDVVLFVLETFRYGNLEADVDGKPATPVLRGLRDDGAVLGAAYSHNGFTVESLVHVLTGSLTETSATSLFDDFRENGYATAVVSGEDETFGDVGKKAGMLQAEYFVDARNDVTLRYTASAAPSSLAVPCTVVCRNLERLLEERRDDERPLFVYVNFQDCHFPYHHDRIEPILAADPVARSDILPENAARVERTYLNTVANVDAAIGRVMRAWEGTRGVRPAFILVGDHGESFFHDGMLGHGIDLVGEQMRIPFLAGGLPVECTFPVALSEIRPILRKALTRTEDTPRTTTDPDKWIFQHAGPLGAPRRIGASSLEGGVIFDMRPRTWRTWGTPAPALASDTARIITFWEQLLLHRADARR